MSGGRKIFSERKNIIVYLLLIVLLLGLVILKSPLVNTGIVSKFKLTARQCMLNLNKFIQIQLRSIKEGELVLISSSETEFDIYNVLSDKNLLITRFNKKDWGTWNIEGWHLSNDGALPSKHIETIAGGGSDWEYVFRVTSNPKRGSVFSGGNHEREILKSFKIINPVDGTEIQLDGKKRVKVKQLRIEEETILTLDGKETSQYARVERVYLIEPSKIELETNFEFTSDIYMELSYLCMLPASKQYGKNILFTNSGNIYSTPDYGQTLTKDNFKNFLGKEEATSVQIWGDEEPYRIEVSIKDREMVNNFSNEFKTFYWDLNEYSNKLYFSIFDLGSPTKISSGTKWKNKAVWKLVIQ